MRGEFSLPEADVTIHARRLVWATPNAAIITSPLSWDLPNAPNAAGTTPGQNGANGRSAGSLRVFVGVVERPDDTRPRFVAQGGQGQDPGQGSDGANGRNKPSWSQHTWRAQDSLLKKLNTPLRMEERVSVGRLTAAGPDAGVLIRVEPREDASIVGAVPRGGEPDLLRLGEGGWREVNYRGVAGWVRP